jgi:hypothetical protein
MLQILLLLSLLLICSSGPGLLATRRLRLSPGERLCAASGISLGFLYIASFLIFVFNLPLASFQLVTAVCLLSTLICIPDLLRLAKRRSVRRRCGAFVFLFVYGFLLLTLVRHYSGGFWFGDWLEHFERTRFFLDHLPLSTRFQDLYLLPARPPLMNLVVGYFLAHTGTHFELFQVACLFLNLLVFFPLCQLAILLGPRGRALPWLTCLLIANPMFQQNACYTWTKLFAAFYVILGLWFYLSGWRKRCGARLVVGFVSLSVAALVHYSAVPYIAVVGLHYLLFVWPGRPHRLREAAAIGLLSAGALLTWFGWSLVTYGARDTFASNTTASHFGEMSLWQNAAKVGSNLYYSVVPHPLRVPAEEFDQPSAPGRLRDYAFLIYQTNAFFAMGCIGGPIVLYRFIRLQREDGPAGTAYRRFWMFFVPGCAVTGIAVHPTEDGFGVAHICLQPLLLIGLTFLAVRYRTLPRAVRLLLWAGLLVDSAVGVYLHFSLENQVFPFSRIGEWFQVTVTPDTLSNTAFGNYSEKVQAGLQFLGDRFAPSADILKGGVLILAAGYIIWTLVRECQPTLRREVTVFFATALTAITACVAQAAVYGIPVPTVHDEFSYLLAADTFARGRCSNPTPPLWPHFETFQVLSQPTYASKYPPGQGLLLASGKLLGQYIFGVWLGVGLAAGAGAWMLRAFVPRSWALAGGLIIASRLGFSKWGWNYWGGGVAFAGGALFVGGWLRLLRRPGPWPAAVMALGLATLAVSRPFEGLLLCVPVGLATLVHFAKSGWPATRDTLRVAAVPLLGVLAPCAVALTYYNYRVTGDALRLPYVEYTAQRDMAPVLLIQQAFAAPVYRHKEISDYQYKWQLFSYEVQRHDFAAWWSFTLVKAKTWWELFVGWGLTPALVVAPCVLAKSPRTQFAALACLFVLGFVATVQVFGAEHYVAPAAPLIYVLIVRGFRYISLWRWRGRPTRRWFVSVWLPVCVLSPALCLIPQFEDLFPEPDTKATAARAHRYLPDWLEHQLRDHLVHDPRAEWAVNRMQLEQQLKSQGGRHLVLVRYASDHSYLDDWVFNEPDIDAAAVVWARPMGREGYERLDRYFVDRTIWLLSVTRQGSELRLLRKTVEEQPVSGVAPGITPRRS